MQKQKTSSTEELYGELGCAFNFTRGDLEANRAGFLSHRQRQTLRKERRDLIKLCLFLATSAYLVVAVISISYDSVNDTSLMWGASFLCSLYIAVMLFALIPFVREIDFGRVQEITEHVELKKRYIYGSNNTWFLVAGNREFPLPRALQLKSNVAYHIFFLPKNKVILSIEEAQTEQD